MLKIPVFCLFLFSVFALCEAKPFPQGELNPEILGNYYPQIMEELEKEFSLQNDGRTKRNTREYGYSFFNLINGNFIYDPPPSFLIELGRHVCDSLGQKPEEFSNIIISVYEEGFHLEPHVDHSFSYHFGEGFYFDENVYAVIIETDPTGKLYFVYYDGIGVPPLTLFPLYILDEKPGTVFCLNGPYRNVPYFHGVSKVLNRRISITFRKVVFY